MVSDVETVEHHAVLWHDTQLMAFDLLFDCVLKQFANKDKNRRIALS